MRISVSAEGERMHVLKERPLLAAATTGIFELNQCQGESLRHDRRQVTIARGPNHGIASIRKAL